MPGRGRFLLRPGSSFCPPHPPHSARRLCLVLPQVREVSLEAAGLVQWLEQVELQLFSSKAMWGPSEATKEKLAPLLVSPFPATPCMPGTAREERWATFSPLGALWLRGCCGS